MQVTACLGSSYHWFGPVWNDSQINFIKYEALLPITLLLNLGGSFNLYEKLLNLILLDPICVMQGNSSTPRINKFTLFFINTLLHHITGYWYPLAKYSWVSDWIKKVI